MAIGGSFLVGIAAVFLLWAAYPHGLIAPDTLGYNELASSLVSSVPLAVDKVRMPGLSVVILFAKLTPFPGAFILWFNGLLFSLCATTIAWIGTVLFKKPHYGFFLGTLFVFCEVLLGEPFFYTAFTLTDIAAASLLFCGILFVYGGWMRASGAIILLGFVFLGISEVFRSMLLIPFFGSVILIWMYAVRTKKNLSAAWIGGFFLALVLPFFLWSVRNALIFKEVDANPYIAIHLLTHAARLWEPGDILFDDPTVNADFHTAMRTQTLVPPYDGPKIFGVPYVEWGVITGFLGSQMPSYLQKNHPTDAKAMTAMYQKEFSAISQKIAIRTILNHPGKYLLHIAPLYWAMFRHNNSGYLLNFAAEDSRATYRRIWNDDHILRSLTTQLLGTAPWELPSASIRASAFLYSAMIGIRTPIPHSTFIFYFLSHLTAIFGILLCRSTRVISFLKLSKEEGLQKGMLLLFLCAVAFVHFISIAFMTVLEDSRYATPGIFPLHFAILLSFCILVDATIKHIRTR